MPGALRQRFEAELGGDFSQVAVHTNTDPRTLSHAVQARAFTTGQDIFFRTGEYNPATTSGQKLIAHELTHVVQQNGGTGEG